MKLELIKQVGPLGEIIYSVYKDGCYITHSRNQADAKNTYNKIMAAERATPLPDEVLESVEI
jgi:hypothetical protein